MKHKYYAIKVGKGVTDKIVDTWAECEPLVLGYPSVYKSFKTHEEAQTYLKTVDAEKIIDKRRRVKNFNADKEVLTVRLDRNLAQKYIDKCKELNLEEDSILRNMIQEWVC